MRASKLIGMKIVNPQDQPTGVVDDVIIDPLQGRVAYIIMRVRKTNKFFPIPMPALTYWEKRGHLMLHVDKMTLQGAPGFTKQDLQALDDRTEGEKIYSYYGYSPYWE